MTIDASQIQIHKQVGDRLALQVMDAPGEVAEMLLIGLEQFLPDFIQ